MFSPLRVCCKNRECKFKSYNGARDKIYIMHNIIIFENYKYIIKIEQYSDTNIINVYYKDTQKYYIYTQDNVIMDALNEHIDEFK
jgi:hypothetical protein